VPTAAIDRPTQPAALAESAERGPDSNRRAAAPQFMLVLSSACPASCSYCFGPHQGPVMDADTLDATVEFVASIAAGNKAQVTFHGGEPLMAGHALLGRACEALRSRLGSQCELSIQSNLWLLDQAFCDLFAKHGVGIGTSLDGPEEVTDAQRGRGYFARTMAGIHLARSRGLRVSCIATFTPATAERWPESMDFFRNERIDFSVHGAVPPLNRSGSPFSLPPAAYAEMEAQLLDAYVEARHDLRIGSLDQICRGVAANDGKVCTFRDCLGMFLAVDPAGDIYPCQRLCSHREHRFGNVADRPSLDDLWASHAAVRWKAREAAVRDVCGPCEHFAYCKGGCAYNSLAAGAGPKDPYCDAYRAIFDKIKTRMLTELASEENLHALATEPWDGTGHPLARRGPLIDLMRDGCHPSEVIRHARRVVASVERARQPDRDQLAKILVDSQVCQDLETAGASLEALEERLRPAERLWNNLYLHVTFACQLRCTHCYAVTDQAGPALPVADLLSLLDQAHQVEFRQLVVTGGEPLLHPDRNDLLAALREARRRLARQSIGIERRHGKATRLVLRTNFALPLTDTEIASVAAAFDQVVVSIDGNKDAHDSRRGAGTFERSVSNLERYQSLAATVPSPGDLALACALPMAEHDQEQEISVRNLAKRLGIRHTRLRPVLPLGRAAEWEAPPTLQACASQGNPLRQIERGFWPTVTCGIGQNLYVDPAGEAFPCYAFRGPHTRIGNVLAQTLSAVLDSRACRDLARHTVDTNRKCRSCEVRYLCGGGCKAWGDQHNQRDLDAPLSDCTALRERAERLLAAAQEYLRRARHASRDSVGSR
jgi:uncharacterized protein